MTRAVVLPLSVLAGAVLSAAARGDGGAVLANQTSGPFGITVFAAPQPLRVGTADVSVLVQEAEGGAPILDADVALQLSPPAGPTGTEAPITVPLTHAQATNKLLYAALLDVPAPGTWMLHLDVRQGTRAAALQTPLTVAAPLPRLRTIWPYLVVPPGAIFTLALHQWLLRRRSTP